VNENQPSEAQKEALEIADRAAAKGNKLAARIARQIRNDIKKGKS
jgi:hypothetical protein